VHRFCVRDEPGQVVPLPGPHIQVQELLPLIAHRASQKVVVAEKAYWCFTLSLRVPGRGKVRRVISFESKDLTGTSAVLVSNRTDWSAKNIIVPSLQRWPIETCSQDGQGHRGLDQYRMRTAEAIHNHWCLVFVADWLWPLDWLPPSPVEGKEKIPAHPVKTIGEVCRQQPPALMESLILVAHDLLQPGQPAASVFARLCGPRNARYWRPPDAFNLSVQNTTIE